MFWGGSRRVRFSPTLKDNLAYAFFCKEEDMPDVVCLGILVADVIARPVSRFPERGKLELVEQMELHTGGCAVNTAIALAKLGISAGVMGKVGSDGFGDFIISQLQKNGLDTRGIRRDPQNKTSATMVLVQEDGERSFIHYLGANAHLRLDDIDFELLKGARIFHVAGAFLLPALDGSPMAEALKRAREMGLTTSLDTAWDSTGRWLQTLAPCLSHLDIFIPSYEEAREISGRDAPQEIAQHFLEYGIRVVGLKMGEKGSFVASQEDSFHLPAYPVQAVDATGAGDAYAAGFLAGWLRGWDLQRIGRLANAAGACCVTAIGATTGIKSLQEIQKEFRL